MKLNPEELRAIRLAIRAERVRREERRRTLPDEWEPWLRELFPRYITTFAPHHREYWDHVWGVEPGIRPRPFVAAWSRGGGKSTSAELGVAALGARGVSRYTLYVRETQDLADKSVGNIGSLLESDAFGWRYPAMAERAVGKYGSAKGWRRNRLATASSFVVDAIGLDTATRGVKFEDVRPDLIVFDDVDGKQDSPRTTEKKIETITHTILPAGVAHAAVLVVQNLMIPDGIVAQLADDRAEWLVDRIVSGPHPALRGLETEPRMDAELGRIRHIITDGAPTWSEQGVERCQAYIDTFGLRAFLEECQHQIHEREGALWKRSELAACRVAEQPPLRRIVVGVDPSGGGHDIGVVTAGLGVDGHGYVVSDRTQKGSLGPLNWGKTAWEEYQEHRADRIVAERNFGGDMVESTIRTAATDERGNRMPVSVKLVTSSRGKLLRAEPVKALYEDGLVHHVGVFPELEQEMKTWRPGDPWSPNRLDALVFALTELMLEPATVFDWSPGDDGLERASAWAP